MRIFRSCGKRDVTTVAPQALTLLNNPFVHEQSAALARRVIAQDDNVDALTESSFRNLLTYMLEDARNISSAIRLTFIGKYFERMADGATNICEMVVYLVEGKMIKHTAPE